MTSDSATPSPQEGQPRQPRPSYPSPYPRFEFQFPSKTPEKPPLTKPPPSDKVTVPDVRGKTQAQAASILAGARLKVGRVSKRIENWPAGTVIHQDPGPGSRVDPYSPVNLVLVEPPPVSRIRVPDLTGQTRDQAGNTLGRVKLKMGRVARRTSDQTPGTVVDQAPDPGTPVSPGKVVDLWLAQPREVRLVTVPDVRGQNLYPAQRQLSNAGRDICDNVGLRVGKVARITSNQTPETVVRQEPGVGSKVTCGTAVNLWLAERPKIELVMVPDVRGQYQGPARSTIAGARLRVGQVGRITSDQTPGTVVDQTPKPGTPVPPNTAVHVSLAAAPTPVPSPPASPEPTPPPPSTPTPAPPSTTTPPAPPPKAPVVTPTPPTPPHQAVKPAVPPPPTPAPPKPAPPPPPTRVMVPNLAGQNRVSARDILTEAGLQEGEVITRRSDLKSGTIIEQTPKPGIRVLPGTPVTLVMSEKKTRWSWAAILVGLLAVLGGGYYGVRKLLRTWILRAIQIRPKKDMGNQHLALDAPLHLDLEVRLKPIADQGQQDLKAAGNLVLDEGEKP